MPPATAPHRRPSQPGASATGARHPHCALPPARRTTVDGIVGRCDERPVVALVAWNLGVHEHILHLTRAPSETIARPSRADHEPRHVALETPRAPLDGALEAQHVVPPHRPDAAAEIGATRPFERGDELHERGLEAARQPRPLLPEREEVLSRARIELLEQRQEPLTDQPALRRAVRRVDPPREPVVPAVLLRLLPPDGEDRTDDAVGATGPDAARRAARDDAVENRLDLVRGGVAGRAQPAVRRQRVPQVTQLRLRSDSVGPDHLGPESVRAVRRVAVGLVPANAVVDVYRPHGVPERPEHVPEARGVRPARDEARDLAARVDQPVASDRPLDARRNVHVRQCASGSVGAGCVGEAWCGRPRAQRRLRASDGVCRELVHAGVRDRTYSGRREASVGRVERVPDRKGVGDGEHDILGPGRAAPRARRRSATPPPPGSRRRLGTAPRADDSTPRRDSARAALPRTPRSGSRRATARRSGARPARRGRARASPASAPAASPRRGRSRGRRAPRGARSPPPRPARSTRPLAGSS